jgi:hypothetical protein
MSGTARTAQKRVNTFFAMLHPHYGFTFKIREKKRITRCTLRHGGATAPSV